MKRIHSLFAALTLLLLAYQTPSKAQSSPVSPSGLTIITHGFQLGSTFPSWVTQMVNAIESRVNHSVPIYTVRYDADTGLAYVVGGGPIDITQSGSAIVLLDWADASNEIANIDHVATQDAADAFLALLFERGHVWHSLAELPIHLIGHSRGASLNSRLAYQLAQSGILVEQVTTLDPHPVTLASLSYPDDWPVITYSNTVFADNYYRTGAPPNGNPVEGAHNNGLSNAIGGTSAGCTDHSEVHTYYHGTIDLIADNDGPIYEGGCTIWPAWYDATTARNETGFSFSRIARGQSRRDPSGISRYLAGGGGTATRVDVSSPDQLWPNAGFGPVISVPTRVSVGVAVPLPYYFTDRTSTQTITFFLDSDMNPFNGVIRDIGSVQKNARTLGTIGSDTYEWTPSDVDQGTRFLGIRTTNTPTDFRVRFDYVLAPVSVDAGIGITGISPSGGTTLGGTPVTLTGTGFQVGATVGIGGVLASNVVVANATTITAVTPAHSAGAADVYVENPDGHSATRLAMFTYATPTTATPSVSTGAASGVNQMGATLSAAVNPNGASTTLYFDYGPTTSYGSSVTYGLAGSGATTATYFYSLTGLSCGTTYQYRARGQNSNGTTNGGNQTFTTGACSQQSGVELLSNGSFASGSTGWTPSGNFVADSRFSNCRTCPGYAYLSNADGTGGNNLLGSLFQTVTIPANATSAALSFWYHITTQETSTTTPFDVLNVTVQDSAGGFLGTVVTLSNLNRTTGYVQVSSNLLAFASAGQTIRLHFLATTDSQLPTVVRVDDVSLLVAAAAMGPSVSTGSATAINLTGATLNGIVNPHGSATSAWFQYGTTTSYGSSTAALNLGTGTSPVATSASVAGLTCGTLYHFRVAGQNGVGAQQGTDQIFATNACGSSAVGTVRVSIVPQAAADAGAQWKLTTETAWHNSGAVVPVPSLATYLVEFKTILGWTIPANKTVVLFPAQTDVWIDSDPYVQQAVLPLYENFSGVGFGSGEFVAISGGNTLVTTPDAVAWVRRPGLNDVNAAGVNYAAGLWVVVGNYNAGRIMTSPNARDWTSRFTDSSVSLRAVAFGRGLHVAAGNKVVTSPDGVNWVVRDMPAFGYGTITGIVFANDTFVAVTEGGMALTSSDAVTWNVVTPPDATSYLGNVGYGNSLFVAVGWAGKILTSPDGTTWTRRESGTGDLLTGVTYANGTFVAVGDGGRVVTSPDGVNWTSRNAGTSNNLRGIAFGNNTFVAAGWSGSIIPLGNAFPPLIVSHPSSATTVTGEDVTFSVAAAGAGPFTYQWQFEGADLTGKTSASLTLQGVTPSQAGNYAVVVQSPSARQVSQAVALIVNARSTPVITWASPAPIVEGTALSSTQLNASSSVVGTFLYTPPVGTTLSAGAGQTLSVLFTPTDTTNYDTATANVTIDVIPSLPDVTVTATDANASEVGPDPGTFTFTRRGATTAALTVNFTTTGTAAVATDFTDVGWANVTIPIGSATATKTVTPVTDAVVEGAETVIVALAAGTYTIATPLVATVTIADAPGLPPIVGSLRDLAIDFGSTYGLWLAANQTTASAQWRSLHGLSPSAMATGDIDGNGRSDVILTFPGYGVWVYSNDATWSQVHGTDAVEIAAGDLDGNGIDDVILSFASYGIWIRYNNVTWVQLHGLRSTGMAIGNVDGDTGGRADLVVNFIGYGVWLFTNNSGWSRLHGLNAAEMKLGDLDGNGRRDLVISFAGYGVWIRWDSGAWTQLHALNSAGMAIGNIDGDAGQNDDVTISLPGHGVWTWKNRTTWTRIHGLNGTLFGATDVDASGRADVIMSFSGYGLWLWRNDGAFVQLHGLSPELVLTGRIDAN